jgi:hypothetical protein
MLLPSGVGAQGVPPRGLFVLGGALKQAGKATVAMEVLPVANCV